ncbi:MAG: DUF2066 domain-containing protein [Magnetococcales bacterium]|nr:DUF2066 domain-containing protein [Magnetococcales bacterium]
MTHPERGTKPGYRWGYAGLLAILLSWSPSADAESPPFYKVVAEAQVALPVEAKQDPRNMGMEIAKKQAFERLLRRMFVRADLEKEKAFFDGLGRESKRLTERLRVVAENQLNNTLTMAVEVTFASKAVAAALQQKGLPFNESLHPPVLFLLRSQGDNPEELRQAEPVLQKNLSEEAKLLGMSVLTPMGDVEDMSQLSWENVANGQASLHQWARARYGTDQLWAVTLQLAPPTGKQQTLHLHLLGGPPRPGSAPIQAEVVAPLAAHRCVEQASSRTCPYAVLARTLLQQLADQWIQAHRINPAQQHPVLLRILHGPKLAQLTQLVNTVRTLPGVTDLRFVEERANESSLEMRFNGDDASLQTLLSPLGAQVELRSSPPPAQPTPVANDTTEPAEHGENSVPPETPAPPPPPARVEVLLRLP